MPPQPRPAPNPEQYAPLRFPQAGLDLSQPFGVPRQLTTPLGVNVRLHEGLTSRGRGGSRPGLGQFVPATVVPATASLIQDLNVVVDPAGVALLGNFDFNPADLYDPSSPGPSFSWGVMQLTFDPLHLVWIDTTTRNPGNALPDGGTGIQPNKNDKIAAWISWVLPDDIEQGTPLDATQLDAVAFDSQTLLPLPGGTYVYSPPAGTVLDAGDGQVLTVTYTPQDQEHYRGGTATVTINVLPPGKHFVQAAGTVGQDNDGSINPSFAVTFTKPVQAGHLLLAVASTLVSAGTVTVLVSDSRGATWSQVGATVNFNLGVNAISLWRALAPSAGPCTVTLAVTSGQQASLSLALLEYTLLDANDGFGSHIDNSIAHDPLSTGLIPVSGTDRVAVGVLSPGGAVQDTAVVVPDPGPTVRAHVKGVQGGTACPELVVLERGGASAAVTMTGAFIDDVTNRSGGLGASFKPT